MAGHEPANPVGWLLGISGGAFLAGSASEAVARAAFARGHGGTLTALCSWIDSWAWTVAIAVALVAVALFPTGRATSRRWAAAVWLLAVATGVDVVATAFAPGRIATASHQTNPLGIPGAGPGLHAAAAAAGPAFVLGGLLSLVSVIVRFRRARDEERQQLRWLGLAAGVTAVAIGSGALLSALGVPTAGLAFVIGVVCIPVAMAVAILRYHLYDIDLVVNRLLLSSLLAGSIAAVYIAITVGIGVHLLGHDRPSTAISVMAVAVIAVVVQPLRERLGLLADRVVYGRRATPYQVLDALAEQLGQRWSLQELAARIAALLADATGAASTTVFVRSDDLLVPAAAWPEDGPPTSPSPALAVDTDLSAVGAEAMVRVDHAGETVGALMIVKAPGDKVSGADQRVLRQLAAQSGLAFGNLRLTAELQRHADEVSARAEELRQSRERLVTAAEAERTRIGRDIHDGAQQDLVALMAKARLAQNQVGRDPALAVATLSEVQSDAKRALAELRELATGIAPPLLADRGLVAAVGSRLSRLPIPAHLDAAEMAQHYRWPSSVEGAAWFVVCESLANALKHANADCISVSIDGDPAELRIQVRDDGSGIGASACPGTGITGMADRVGAIGGHLEVGPAAPHGTIVAAWIPAERA